MKRRVREVIVVEGRYDKNTLSQVVEATILETGGFGIFKDREKAAWGQSGGSSSSPTATGRALSSETT